MTTDVKEWRERVRAIKDEICITAGRGGKSRNKGDKKRKRKKKEIKNKSEGASGKEGVDSGNDGSEEQEEEEEDDDSGEGGWKPRKPRRTKPIRGMVRCCDGFAMSVQASSEHACVPRNDIGPYAEVEVGYPNQLEPLLMPFCATPSLIVKHHQCCTSTY